MTPEETPRIVLDTNVLVSGLLSARGPPAGVLNLVIDGAATVVPDTRIFGEYAEVLKREKFGFPAEAVQEILAFMRREGVFVLPAPVNFSVPDPGDLPFIEVALHERVPIVTGNVRHFRDLGVPVVTPAGFLERWRDGGR